MTREEAIEYWEGLRKTFSSQIEKEENHFGRMHLQTTIDALDVAIDALRQQEQERNEPLTMDELRSRASGWVWVVVDYEHCKCDGWALVPTPAFVAYLDQTIPIDFYGKKFVAYDHKLEEDDHA